MRGASKSKIDCTKITPADDAVVIPCFCDYAAIVRELKAACIAKRPDEDSVPVGLTGR
jgi:hypothetical protein